MPLQGDLSYRSLDSREATQAFFERHFPDVLDLAPGIIDEFGSKPPARYLTSTTAPWCFAGRIVLLGDACHSVLPFYGQGMNAAFEDCVGLDDLIGRLGHAWREVFAEFEAARAPNARAIAEMAIENYLEMRDEVRDAKFELRAAVSFELERRFAGRWIPRYSMVMFHPEIAYSEAQRRGAVQSRILSELTARATTVADVDFARAAELIAAAL